MPKRVSPFMIGALLVLVLLVGYAVIGAETNQQSPETTPEAEVTQEPEATAEVSVTVEVVTTATEGATPAELCESALPVSDPQNRTFERPEQVLEANVDYRAIFCTSAGAIYIDLLEEHTPNTVNNFVFLAENGFYNNTIFHRVIEGFMAQGGDPTATGAGGPGYQFDDEFVAFLTFDTPYWLAMANAGPGTNGSQFFITTVPTPHLDYRHTIFGEVLEGEENVLDILIRDPQQPNAPATTLNTVLIIADPSQVGTTYAKPAPATRDEIIEAFEGMAAVVDQAQGLSHNVQVSEAGDLAGTEALVEDYGLEFSVTSEVSNADCDTGNFPFISLTYSIDVYPGRDDATGALNSGILQGLAEASGFALAEPSIGLYTRSDEGCAGETMYGLLYAQRGRYVVTVMADVPVVTGVPAGDVVEFISQRVHEITLTDILRQELR